MSIGQFLLAKGITVEKVLEIEYIKGVIPRKEDEPSLHDDWVSAVEGSNPGSKFIHRNTSRESVQAIVVYNY
ncbi:hypothetical protein AgCh_016397 [Apium graveolens]